jgi:outer membrane lipoprotein-sorting protein
MTKTILTHVSANFWMRMLIAMVALINIGCRTEQIPNYPQMDETSSLRILAERTQQIRTISAQGTLTLTGSDNQTVRLDVAIASQPPQRMRLRAWKFGQGIFDLTLTPEGIFIVTPDNDSRKQQIKSAGISAGDFMRTWSMLSGGLFEAPHLEVEFTIDKLRIIRTMAGEPTIICIVDRATLTPRRYELVDNHGKRRFSLMLDQYTSINNLVWPRRLVATSEKGTINIELREIELNGDLPAEAFVPPRRAERLP